MVVLAGAAPAFTSSNGVVISEFRFRGPAGGNDEYVELMNAGSGPVDIGSWQLQGCASTTGLASSRVTVPAGVTLQAGEHYLFFNNNATGGYSGSVPGDRGYGTGFTDGAGARIVDASANVVDGVSGTLTAASDCREGSGIAGMPGTNGDQSYERKNGGTQDTNDNATDFAGPKAGDPQNHQGADATPAVNTTNPSPGAPGVATAANVSVTFSEPVTLGASWDSISCGASGAHSATTSGGPTTFTLDPDTDFSPGETCTVTVFAAQVSDQDTNDPPDHPIADFMWTFTTAAPATPTFIHEIQGAAHLSPKAGQLVSSVPGIVTAKTTNGFWMQDPAPDADEATSEGIFVFTSSAPAVNVGDSVQVNARVQEFRPGGASNGNLTTTELASPSVSILSTGNPLPAPTVIGTGGRIPPDTIIDNDSTGNAETSGVFDPAQDGLDFYESLEGMRVQLNNAVAVGPTEPDFGETPVIGDDGANASVRTYRGGLLLRPDDGNPERVTLDDLLTPLPNVNVGDHYSGPIVGVMDYNFGNPFIEVTSPGLTRI
ncbi:MAG TPA: Ig-like domain-containing protein, partial [Gaiellaceae bacterium]|nr:Ig-like domain-containing protein [Gaiellaceae bacterium]